MTIVILDINDEEISEEWEFNSAIDEKEVIYQEVRINDKGGEE
jgi:hypothetical protein